MGFNSGFKGLMKFSVDGFFLKFVDLCHFDYNRFQQVAYFTSGHTSVSARHSRVCSHRTCLSSYLLYFCSPLTCLVASYVSLLVSRVFLLATHVSGRIIRVFARISYISARHSCVCSHLMYFCSHLYPARYASTHRSKECYKLTLYRIVQYTLGLSLSLGRCCDLLSIYTKHAEHDIRPDSETGLVLFWRLTGPDTTILMTETNRISKVSHFEATNHNTVKNLSTFW